MTTLIAVYNSEGCVGGPGLAARTGNHGAGLEQAVDNTRELPQQWLTAYAQQNRVIERCADVPATAPVQLALL